MSMDYIRRAYSVAAKRGGRVRFENDGDTRDGVIVGARGAYLRVRFDGERKPRTLHPTWRVEYLKTPNVRANRAPALKHADALLPLALRLSAGSGSTGGEQREVEMTADIELLLTAARAAGIECTWHFGCGDALLMTAPDATAIYWNPLRDDQDAFRLAVRLGIHVFSPDHDAWHEGRDPLPAVRRDIVSKAARLAPMAVVLPNVRAKRALPDGDTNE